MTGPRNTSYSWRALLLVAICSTVGGVLLTVWVTPPDDRPAGGTASVGVGSAPGSSPSPRPKNGLPVPRRPALVPVRLQIPAIHLATRVVRLGLMPDRTVEVPSDPDQAGWFHHGPTPGRRGSAVILGHVDSSEGPAVFARLQELQRGDTVRVQRGDGSIVQFVVTETVLYPNADFPAQRVYAAPGGRRLNLVTCGGIYDSNRGGYQSNLVVFTRAASARLSPASVSRR